MRQHHDPRMEFIDKVESTESQDRERNLVGGSLSQRLQGSTMG